MPKLVIIGGSFAGHKALSAFYANSNGADIEAVVVSPSDDAWFNVAAPRLLVKPEEWTKTVVPLKNSLDKISKGKATHLKGKATAVDFDKQTVSVATAAGSETVPYDYLVIASGSATKFAGFKTNLNADDARKAIENVHQQLQTARTVAVVGGGPTGVEVSGEIASEYPEIKVTLYSGQGGPLAATPLLVRGATAKLEQLGVEVVNGVRVSKQGDAIVLPDASTKNYDLVLEAYTTTPYTEYLPSAVLDSRGYVVTDSHFVVKNHPNVFALGDVVADTPGTVLDLNMSQIRPFTAAVKAALGAPAKQITYSRVDNMLIVPVSKNGGVGLLFGWRVPSLFVWLVKLRTFMVDKSQHEFA